MWKCGERTVHDGPDGSRTHARDLRLRPHNQELYEAGADMMRETYTLLDCLG